MRGKAIDPAAGLSWDDRLAMGREEVATILRKVWPYLLVGIGVGAVIHGWVPSDWFAKHASSGLRGVPIAVVIGVPLYSNAAGLLPLVESLHSKGLPMGTVLAFMMSVVALSLPEMILLRRVLKPKLITTYVAVVAVSILLTGYMSGSCCAIGLVSFGLLETASMVVGASLRWCLGQVDALGVFCFEVVTA